MLKFVIVITSSWVLTLMCYITYNTFYKKCKNTEWTWKTLWLLPVYLILQSKISSMIHDLVLFMSWLIGGTVWFVNNSYFTQMSKADNRFTFSDMFRRNFWKPTLIPTISKLCYFSFSYFILWFSLIVIDHIDCHRNVVLLYGDIAVYSGLCADPKLQQP